ncbi:MAG: hypothetical protein HY365_00480 [Candidatus Aenigmarchaeota archaeon]|nr:hypothetical protein [Candidatus Aenigmarchaeota archaeon]
MGRPFRYYTRKDGSLVTTARLPEVGTNADMFFVAAIGEYNVVGIGKVIAVNYRASDEQHTYVGTDEGTTRKGRQRMGIISDPRKQGIVKESLTEWGFGGYDFLEPRK